MSDFNNQSRLNKFEKRRKNTKKISILMIIASILIIILLAIWIFGGKDKDTSSPDNNSIENGDVEIGNDDDSEDQDKNNAAENEGNQNQSDEDSEDNVIDEDLEINENENIDVIEDIETEPAEPTDDNVIEAYTGNWKPIGTIQEGPHTTVYDDGSQDRIEIKQAIISATGLGEDMIEWRIANGGDQKVLATVANPENTEYYRVYLSWIDNEGWQPTKVEKLSELQY